MRAIVGLWMLSALALSAPPAGAAPHNPELTATINGVRDEGHAAPLDLRRLDLGIVVRGSVAEVTLDATFANPGTTVLEGDFRFALPEGAVVTGYALDVRGGMVPGVLVDRPRAQAIYDARVRRGVDPGLAEIRPGNVFETRVHPIFPGTGRRIRLTFAVALDQAGLKLPLDFAPPREGWSIAIDSNAAGEVRLPDGRQLKLAPHEGAWQVRAQGKGSGLAGAVELNRGESGTLLTRHRSGEVYVQLSGALPAPVKEERGPERLRVYWDRSRSRLLGRLDEELALLRALIARSAPSEIELVAFNSSGVERHVARDAESAVAWLKALRYRGATSLAGLTQGDDAGVTRCLLFSNGRPTLDIAAPFAPRCRLDAVTSAPGADLAWLEQLAMPRGGTAHRLSPGGAEALAAQLGQGYAGVTAVEDRDGRPVPFLSLAAPSGAWQILAQAPVSGPLTVRVARGAASTTDVRALPGEAVDFDAPAALLAARRLSALNDATQRGEYVALSRRYGIASPSLSFLVLESAGDYLAAGVEPPAGLPAEWRDDYWRTKKAREAAEVNQAQERLNRLAHDWADEQAWWKQRFDPKAKPQQIATSDHFDQTAPARPTASVPLANNGARVLQAPPPPPPPSPSPLRVTPAESQEIIVTSSRVEGDDNSPARERSASAGYQAAAGRAANPGGDGPHIVIDAWQPERPYLELYDGKPAEFDERFLEAEARHGNLPIFYLDTAEWLRRHGRVAESAEMVLSALDLPSANEVTLGIVADRLERYGALDRAIALRERAAALDPDRPQPRRLLALALARRARLQPATARADLARAIALLYAVATEAHAPEWAGIELIALNEANALLPRLKAAGGTAQLDPRLVGVIEADMRVVIDWTSDGSDMDLWIDEPNGERAIYNHPRTVIGGHLSRDMTRGYGPEEYMLRRAPAGTYRVQANVFAPDRLDPNGATILTAHLIRNFGRPDESEDAVDVELKRDEHGAKVLGHIDVAK